MTSATSPLVKAGVALGVAAGLTAGLAARARRQSDANNSFEGRVIVITGASRGLGLALARCFAAEHAHLVLLARDADALRAALPQIRASGAASGSAFPCDVTDAARVDATIDQILASYGRIDVLVNNAGVIRMSPVEHTQPDDYRASLDTHFWGPLHMVRACLPHMIRQGGGRIVNIASVGGYVAVPHLLPYTVGKFALVGFSEGLHAELRQHNISVTTVSPFVMRTGSHRNVEVRGQHTKEAVLFALAASTSLTSIDAEEAATEIVEAVRRRRARVSPGWQSRAAELARALAPEQTGLVLSWVAQYLLPGPGRSASAGTLRRSRDLDTGLAAAVFPTAAAQHLNQDVAADEQRH